jgi:hypothetical protein
MDNGIGRALDIDAVQGLDHLGKNRRRRAGFLCHVFPHGKDFFAVCTDKNARQRS